MMIIRRDASIMLTGSSATIRLGLGIQRPRDRDALEFAARELVGVLAAYVRRIRVPPRSAPWRPLPPASSRLCPATFVAVSNK